MTDSAATDFLLENAHTFVGKELAVTEWIFIDQMQANVFGEVTRWNHWMHSDPERCERESPYGGALLHGFMLVSLVTHFHATAHLRPADAARSLNYGCILPPRRAKCTFLWVRTQPPVPFLAMVSPAWSLH